MFKPWHQHKCVMRLRKLFENLSCFFGHMPPNPLHIQTVHKEKRKKQQQQKNVA